MPEPQTATDGDQASTSGSPQAGTPATDGQAPVSHTTTESERDRIIEQLRKENAASRKKLTAYEEAEKAAQEANLSETQKLQQQYAEQQALNEQLAIALFERDVHEEVAQYASELNFLDGIPSKYLARMLDWDEIEEADGKPANVKKLLGELAKAVPVLVKQQEQQQRGTPALPAMNPGRSSIQPPGGSIPGRIPRLEDIEWKR
jgi:hypothetical protein